MKVRDVIGAIVFALAASAAAQQRPATPAPLVSLEHGSFFRWWGLGTAGDERQRVAALPEGLVGAASSRSEEARPAGLGTARDERSESRRDGATTPATATTILATPSATAIETTMMAVRTSAEGRAPATRSQKPTRVITTTTGATISCWHCSTTPARVSKNCLTSAPQIFVSIACRWYASLGRAASNGSYPCCLPPQRSCARTWRRRADHRAIWDGSFETIEESR